ncbi:hypothetical protein PtrSN002B_010412 [Pyrenophora tritici-repentis]|nr:hypothetical protein PtrV1_05906 [Pyrenophora tritici-repentis]KAF7573260.1 hypothetical protein PtrM4_081650 [Pyrenophora tritici-repentis]KAG9381143.1 hypothetical protein A1F94_008463 [Pyrenophora tritici-repentis]KAI0570819.1 hypothetical protein Alg215_10812 [Pyrenophora tritici-repentis]KAI0578747.1 hypothetical protein Alg130_07811 [Pyrenophora tritici-repentis]
MLKQTILIADVWATEEMCLIPSGEVPPAAVDNGTSAGRYRAHSSLVTGKAKTPLRATGIGRCIQEPINKDPDCRQS